MNKVNKDNLEDKMHTVVKSALSAVTALVVAGIFCSIPCQGDENRVQTADTPDEAGNRTTLLYDEESSDAEHLLKLADKIAKEAAVSYQKGLYQEAINKYLKASSILKKLSSRNSAVEAKITLCKQAISRCYFFWAEKLYYDALTKADEKQYDDAIRYCEKAIEIWPPAKAKLQKAITQFKNQKKGIEIEKKFDADNIDKERGGKTQREYTTEILMRQGNAFYKDGQYDHARDKFEEILAVDPYNTAAIEAIRSVNMKMLKAGALRRSVTRNEMVAEVSWKSVNPVKARITSPKGKSSSDSFTLQKNQGNISLIEKLKTIIIPKVEFKEAEISQILNFLREASKKEKINILYLRSQGINAEKGEAEGGEGNGQQNGPAEPTPQGEGNNDNGGEVPAGVPAPEGDKSKTGAEEQPEPVRSLFHFENESLYTILTELCKPEDLTLKIDEYAVVVADKNFPFEKLQTRVYMVEKNALDKATQKKGGSSKTEAAATGGAGDAGGDSKSSEALWGDTSVRTYFEDRKIPFTEPGADAYFDKHSNRLIITNTRDKFDEIEKIINELNVVDPQILVQTKFVEVALKDLEELGFQYSFSRGNENMTYQKTAELTKITSQSSIPQDKYINYYKSPDSSATGAQANYSTLVGTGTSQSIPAGANYYTVAPLQSKSVSFGANSQVVRSVTSLGDQTNAVDGFFNYQYTSNQGYKLNATINAIDQADSTDILACPKITTMNGYEASISMVKEQYFPDDWDDAEIGTIDNQPIFTPSIPTFDEAERLGIELRVKPMVDMTQNPPEFIELKMNPLIKSFYDWTDYSYTLTVSTGNNESTPYKNTIKKPIFEVRSISTMVSCLDGETMVLGGIIIDEIKAIDDQYPILGEVPLVGRLFQSKAKNSQKRNLLIFMTCRLINPDGTPVREAQMRGLPAFRQ